MTGANKIMDFFGKNVFLFWHEGEKLMPIIHKMNIENIRKRLKNTEWNLIVTSLNINDENYIENYINLPDYFHGIKSKISDQNGVYGNQSDIIRLRLLEKYGGVYFDTSTIFLKKRIEDISLFKIFVNNINIQLAGYTNVTFTRKTSEGESYFPQAKDGIELGVLYARKDSELLKKFNYEIDLYWQWKTKEKNYKSYPEFKKLTSVSFLNEYHIHYSIYHMIITREPKLLDLVETQSIHMKGKEEAVIDGPYAITDRFCRGKTSYERANSELLLKSLLPGNLNMFNEEKTTLQNRIELFKEMQLIVIPSYLRVEIEKVFTSRQRYEQIDSAYQFFYDLRSF